MGNGEIGMMRVRCFLVVVGVCLIVGSSWAATFYVDAAGGIDTNDGLSPATAGKTVAKVNGATFAAGDQMLFKRGQVWNESLAPPSSGASGNPIVFDAYGTGEAPTLTGYVGLPSGSWTLDSGNIWKTSITSSSFNYVLFGYIGSNGTVGSVWGTKFTTGKSALVAPYQFYFSCNVLYVYATSNPASYYGSMAAMLMTNGQIIYINGKSWLTIQHFKLTYFDTYGLRIGGASDHITIANVYSDGVIPAGTTPHGFYVSASPAPTDIKFYNVEGLFGNRSGREKKDSAISFVTTALQLSEAVANREIVDEEKSKEGLSKVIDGTVQCLNASSWSRTNKQ